MIVFNLLGMCPACPVGKKENIVPNWEFLTSEILFYGISRVGGLLVSSPEWKAH